MTDYSRIPEHPTRGMVVIHEILGPQPEIERVVDRFAARGYAAVAPELFKSPLSVTCIRSAMMALSTGKGPFVEQLRESRTWLCEQAGLREDQVGLIGFCLGGGFALAAGSGWAAVSTNYGDLPKPDVLRGIGPVIGCYGGRDLVFGKMAPKLEALIKPLGVEVETHTYPTVGHSFLTDGAHPVLAALTRPFFHVEWNAEVAEDAWTKILAFMDSHLPT